MSDNNNIEESDNDSYSYSYSYEYIDDDDDSFIGEEGAGEGDDDNDDELSLPTSTSEGEEGDHSGGLRNEGGGNATETEAFVAADDVNVVAAAAAAATAAVEPNYQKNMNTTKDNAKNKADVNDKEEDAAVVVKVVDLLPPDLKEQEQEKEEGGRNNNSVGQQQQQRLCTNGEAAEAVVIAETTDHHDDKQKKTKSDTHVAAVAVADAEAAHSSSEQQEHPNESCAAAVAPVAPVASAVTTGDCSNNSTTSSFVAKKMMNMKITTATPTTATDAAATATATAVAAATTSDDLVAVGGQRGSCSTGEVVVVGLGVNNDNNTNSKKDTKATTGDYDDDEGNSNKSSSGSWSHVSSKLGVKSLVDSSTSGGDCRQDHKEDNDEISSLASSTSMNNWSTICGFDALSLGTSDGNGGVADSMKSSCSSITSTSHYHQGRCRKCTYMNDTAIAATNNTISTTAATAGAATLGICIGCGCALLPNPCFDVDEQIALNLQRKEEKLLDDKKRKFSHQEPIFVRSKILVKEIWECIRNIAGYATADLTGGLGMIPEASLVVLASRFIDEVDAAVVVAPPKKKDNIEDNYWMYITGEWDESDGINAAPSICGVHGGASKVSLAYHFSQKFDWRMAQIRQDGFGPGARISTNIDAAYEHPDITSTCVASPSMHCSSSSTPTGKTSNNKSTASQNNQSFKSCLKSIPENKSNNEDKNDDDDDQEVKLCGWIVAKVKGGVDFCTTVQIGAKVSSIQHIRRSEVVLPLIYFDESWKDSVVVHKLMNGLSQMFHDFFQGKDELVQEQKEIEAVILAAANATENNNAAEADADASPFEKKPKVEEDDAKDDMEETEETMIKSIEQISLAEAQQQQQQQQQLQQQLQNKNFLQKQHWHQNANHPPPPPPPPQQKPSPVDDKLLQSLQENLDISVDNVFDSDPLAASVAAALECSDDDDSDPESFFECGRWGNSKATEGVTTVDDQKDHAEKAEEEEDEDDDDEDSTVEVWRRNRQIWREKKQHNHPSEDQQQTKTDATTQKDGEK